MKYLFTPQHIIRCQQITVIRCQLVTVIPSYSVTTASFNRQLHYVKTTPMNARSVTVHQLMKLKILKVKSCIGSFLQCFMEVACKTAKIVIKVRTKLGNPYNLCSCLYLVYLVLLASLTDTDGIENNSCSHQQPNCGVKPSSAEELPAKDDVNLLTNATVSH